MMVTIGLIGLIALGVVIVLGPLIALIIYLFWPR